MPHPFSGNGLYVDMAIYKTIIRILFIYLLVMAQMFTCWLNTLRWKGKKVMVPLCLIKHGIPQALGVCTYNSCILKLGCGWNWMVCSTPLACFLASIWQEAGAPQRKKKQEKTK
jgi:hypothetical protein